MRQSYLGKVDRPFIQETRVYSRVELAALPRMVKQTYRTGTGIEGSAPEQWRPQKKGGCLEGPVRRSWYVESAGSNFSFFIHMVTYCTYCMG